MWMLSALEMSPVMWKQASSLNQIFQSEGSAASYHRIPPQTLPSFPDTQLSETGRHASCTDACVDRFEICAVLSKAIPHFLRLLHRLRVGDEATLARMVPTVSGVRTRGLFLPLFLPVTFPVAETDPPSSSYSLLVLPCICTVFWTGAGLWQSNLFAENIPQIEFSVLVSGGAILNDVTAASVTKYGKNTNVWRLRRCHLHPAVYFIVYRSTKIDSNWVKHAAYVTSYTSKLC